ncbi:MULTISPECIES: hypothetical protein [unclassified Pseudomonas]|uniref:hypothetical protein n=1 Tax=unclassified Pseudomonas TaxID=196821 RepID=UPI0027251CEF|nr:MULTISPECIES: hypothetical protein [unclassified Pseudomonas]MDO8402830.1 hypothetical protein [Pseudomonas sp.]WNF55570.1 hypothetical protein RHP74_30580 [Pseudomonas sp. SG20052]
MNQRQVKKSAGSLDPEFGDQGSITVPIGTTGAISSAILALPEGKLLIAVEPYVGERSFTVARLNENGALDTTFGVEQNGVVRVIFEDTYVYPIFGLIPLSDGGWVTYGQYTSKNSDGLAFVRQRQDGTLEESFGARGGRFIPYNEIGNPEQLRVKADILHRDGEKGAEVEPQRAGNSGYSAVAQSNGKIFFAASISPGPGISKGLVLRLNSDGTTDKTFNGVGSAIVELPGVAHNRNQVDAIAVQVDGKVLVSGYYANDSDNSRGGYVMRFDAEGQVDASFNEGVPVTISDPAYRLFFMNAISVRESDGGIVAVGDVRRGSLRYGMIVVLNSSGSFNRVFNRGMPLYSDMLPEGLAWNRCSWQANGAIVVAGNRGDGSVWEQLVGVTARYLSDGTLDPTFNLRGWVVFDLEYVYESVQDMAIMADGRIVLCGHLWRDSTPWHKRFGGFVARYLV